LRTTYRSFALGVLISFSALAQPSTFQDPLLDHMIGKWVLQGTIAGRNTTHDIVSEWVLGHQYMRIQECPERRTPGPAGVRSDYLNRLGSAVEPVHLSVA